MAPLAYWRVSGAEYLDDQVAVPSAIQFEQEDPLPAAEVHAAIGDRYVLTAAEQEVLAMRVAVGALLGVHLPRSATQVVVLVFAGSRRQPLQQCIHIPKQERFVFLQHDRGGGVFREYRYPALADSGACNHGSHLIGDVDELPRDTGWHLQRLGPEGHPADAAYPGLLAPVSSIHNPEQRIRSADEQLLFGMARVCRSQCRFSMLRRKAYGVCYRPRQRRVVRTLSKQSLQYTGRPMVGVKGTWAGLPHSAQITS